MNYENRITSNVDSQFILQNIMLIHMILDHGALYSTALYKAP